MKSIEEIKAEISFNENGLVPAVLQDSKTKEVLMVAYMNEDALDKTLETKKVHFWSRSRKQLWLKGETSGNYQYVKGIKVDCDQDTLLIEVKPAGPACHTGEKSCFFTELIGTNSSEVISTESGVSGEQVFLQKAVFLKRLSEVIQDRKQNPKEDSYTNYLLSQGIDKVCKKIGEEAAEVIIGAKNDSKEEIIYEAGDLIYHLLVMFNIKGIAIEEVLAELESRSS